MANTWTIIVFGVLLHVMTSDSQDSISTTPSNLLLAQSEVTTQSKATDSNSSPTVINTHSTPQAPTVASTVRETPSTANSTPPPSLFSTTQNEMVQNTATQPNTAPSTAPSNQFTTTVTRTLDNTTPSQASLKANITPEPTNPALLTTSASPEPGERKTTAQPITDLNIKPDEQSSSANPSSLSVQTTPATSVTSGPTLPESSTQTLNKPELDFTTTISPNLQTTQTTISMITSAPQPGQHGLKPETTTSTTSPKKFNHPSIDLSSISNKGNFGADACKTVAQDMKKGNCTVTVEIMGKQLIATVTIEVSDNKLIPTDRYELENKTEVMKSTEPYKPLEENEEIPEGAIPDTLIAILASCGALVLILCFFAAYCTYHRRSYRKNQQHLTEELQTVENGYHDNPTLEVMEVQPEMQEKKVALNGEFNDSWIVPIDNLLKEDMTDEEDTHL